MVKESTRKYGIKKIGKEYLEEAVKLERVYMLPPLASSLKKKNLVPILENGLMFGLFHGKKLIGKVGYIKSNKSEYNLAGMVIIPAYQGKKLGEKLVSKSMREVLKLSPSVVYLYVHPQNSRAIVLYLKQGFEIREWLPNKFGEGQHRLKMVYRNTGSKEK